MKIERIDPPSWFAGMEDTTLQLMLTGEDLDNAEITVRYPGIEVIGTERADSHRYAFLYLGLAACGAGTMYIDLRKDGETLTVPYELRDRAMAGSDRESLSPADVVYLLMPDRFARGRRHATAGAAGRAFQPSARCGGDLEGIRRHLPYLADLGVTALWLTPVLRNNMPETDRESSYHGYAVTDYYAIDAHFGTLDDYLALVREAHRRGLKVVMDFIFNHCGAAHPWLNHPPMEHWFNHRDWLEGADVEGGRLPKTNPKYLQTNYRLTPTVDDYAAQVDKRKPGDASFETP